MDEQNPPPKPRRTAIPLYLTEEERACIDRVAPFRGRGPWIRRAVLYRAGWHGYSGPMFDATDAEAAQRVEDAQHGDVLHELLRTMGELGATCCALVKSGNPPRPDTYRLLMQLCRIVHRCESSVPMLRRFDDSLEVALDLEAAGVHLAADNAIVGNELGDVARLLLEALSRKEKNHG